MDYDFSGLCFNQLERLAKRLAAINKSFIKEYDLALGVINNEQANDHYNETMIEVGDLFRDQISKTEITYTETMNKVQRCLRKYL